MPTEKTALVVVHGVADQLPGATARSIVDLLVGPGRRIDDVWVWDVQEFAARG